MVEYPGLNRDGLDEFGGGGKKRKTSSSKWISVANEFNSMSEEGRAKYRELRQLFETWGGVTPQMTNSERMTKIINKINQSMRLNAWYAMDGLKKSKIIENRNNYCNFCSPEGRDPKPIEALNEWRNRRGQQPMMGGKRKTRRRNKKQRRKKPKRRKKTKRRKKGGYGPEAILKSDEALFDERFPNWYRLNEEPLYVTLQKRRPGGGFRKIRGAEGLVLNKNRHVITLSDNSPFNPFGIKDYRWNDFDKLIVNRGREGGILGPGFNTFDGA